MELHRHRTKMKDIFGELSTGGYQVLFLIRDPVSRFRSGFNSRLRMGRPRYNSPWRPNEKVAFERFKTSDELASALDAGDAETRRAAEFAMNSIQHVRNRQSEWLVSPEYLEKHRDRIFYIGLQETFEDDVRAILRKLGVDDTLPEMDERTRHATPAGYDMSLSERAVANLRKWYADDYAIYDWCVRERAAVNGRELGS